jgi:hypothetical protein
LPAVRRWTSAGSRRCPSSKYRGEDLVLGRRTAQARGDRGPERARDVAERPERAWGAQGVAHAPQDRRRHPFGERAQERGLADARLTHEQNEVAVARCRPFRPGSAALRSGGRAPTAAPAKCKRAYRRWSAPQATVMSTRFA